MQVTKELIENDIVALKAQVEQIKASMASTMGALSALEGVLAYMNRPEPAPTLDISDTNKAVQESLEAISLQDIAEEIAGPGAEVEIEPMEWHNGR